MLRNDRVPTTLDENGDRKPLSKPPNPNAKNLPGTKGQALGNRLIYELFIKIMPEFITHLEQTDAVTYGDLIGKLKTAQAKSTEKEQMNGYLEAYKTIEDDPGLNDMFSTRFGVNEQIKPQIGDALVYVSDPNEYDDNKAKNNKALDQHLKEGGSEDTFVEDEKWNFHWAGVILTDGSSYVTFENLSTENEDDRNTNWYFKFHGNKKDPFHTRLKDDPHATKHGITAVITGI